MSTRSPSEQDGNRREGRWGRASMPGWAVEEGFREKTGLKWAETPSGEEQKDRQTRGGGGRERQKEGGRREKPGRETGASREGNGPLGILQSPGHSSHPSLSPGQRCSFASLICLRIASQTLLLLVQRVLVLLLGGHWARMLLYAVQASMSGSLLGSQMPYIVPWHRPFQPELSALGPGQLQGAQCSAQ